MVTFAKKAANKILSFVLNNPDTNWLLVLFSLDHLPKELLHRNDWEIREYNDDKTLEENVGYSMVPHIQNLVEIARSKFIEFAETHLEPTDAILDIGCGTVVMLKSLENSGFYLYGIDMNRAFLKIAEKRLPKAHFFKGNYLKDFIAPKKFNLICCFSVLMYVEPSNLKAFFDKIYNDLAPGGYAFFQYHHAMDLLDLLYPDITYVRYSPHKLENAVRDKFNIVKHEQFYNGRKIGWYDSQHYFFPDGTNTRLDTIENTCLLIIQRKESASPAKTQA